MRKKPLLPPVKCLFSSFAFAYYSETPCIITIISDLNVPITIISDLNAPSQLFQVLLGYLHAAPPDRQPHHPPRGHLLLQ